MKIITSAFVIIGDEILSGRTKDKNLNFIAKRLLSIGIMLKETRIIGDEEDLIVTTIKELKKKYDYVFTSGGIGPTHDDITSISIAKAFDDKLIKNSDAERILLEYYGHDINKARMKMSYLPSRAKLLDNPITSAPGFILENVIVMAGVPKIMQIMFEIAKNNLVTGSKIFSKEIKINLTEGEIANFLIKLLEEFKNISIGSYPSEKETSIVIKGLDKKEVNNAVNKLVTGLNNAINIDEKL